MIRKLSIILAVALALVGVTAASPAYAGRSACPGTYVCAWNNASWTGTQISFQPSAIYQGSPAHCLNFNATSSQDAISSLASYNSALDRIEFFKDINCYELGGYYTLYGTGQVKDLAGTGFNDTFSSVRVPSCC
jgi:hypothetical protein